MFKEFQELKMLILLGMFSFVSYVALEPSLVTNKNQSQSEVSELRNARIIHAAHQTL